MIDLFINPDAPSGALLLSGGLRGAPPLAADFPPGPPLAGGGLEPPQGLPPHDYPYDVILTRRDYEGFGFVIISSVAKSGSLIGQWLFV